MEAVKESNEFNGELSQSGSDNFIVKPDVTSWALNEIKHSVEEKLSNVYQRLGAVESTLGDYNIKNGALNKIEVKSDQTVPIIMNIEHEIEDLKRVTEIRDQIIQCASIVQNILKLIDLVQKTSDGNYRKNLFMLLYQAIKRNYKRQLFSKQQVELLLKGMQLGKNVTVSKDQYLDMDEDLYLHDLDTIAVEE